MTGYYILQLLGQEMECVEGGRGATCILGRGTFIWERRRNGGETGETVCVGEGLTNSVLDGLIAAGGREILRHCCVEILPSCRWVLVAVLQRGLGVDGKLAIEMMSIGWMRATWR